MDVSEFDYIIVGGGSSGACLAARLSEDRGSSVLLLEAGPKDRGLWVTVPIGYAKVIGNPAMMWNYESEPELSLNGRRISAMRGRMLGGSSSVNAFVYARGMPQDYDSWHDHGATGWAFDDVLPYFRKSEHYCHGGLPHHGDSGPIGVEDGRWRNRLADAFVDAAEAAGFPRNNDLSSANPEGVGYYQLTTWRGRRSSSTRYLKQAASRPNLLIETEALVTGIELQGRDAKGVRYERGGTVRKALARREVILCAGSINTPQLLQLSGLGPAHILRAHGVEVIHDIPGVGENLCDHISAKRAYITSSPDTINAMVGSVLRQGMAGLRYITSRTGPLAVGSVTAGGYVKTVANVKSPDLQLFFIPFNSGEYWNRLAPESSFQIAGYQCRPESRGYVHIQSSDPRVPPKVAPNYLATENDRRTLIDGLRLIKRIGSAEPLRAFDVHEIAPKLADESDEALLDYIRATATTGFHHVGTCKMGNDPLSVVDPDLRVRGVNRLRIADGSVMPALISGNTNAACMMIAEKCADIVRGGTSSRAAVA